MGRFFYEVRQQLSHCLYSSYSRSVVITGSIIEKSESNSQLKSLTCATPDGCNHWFYCQLPILMAFISDLTKLSLLMFAINTLMVHFVLIVLFVLTILPQFLINQRGTIEVKSFILLVIEVLAEISSGSISLKRLMLF